MRPRLLRSLMMRFCISVALLGGTAPLLGGARPAGAVATADVVADAEWILQSTFADGAIGHYSDRVMVRPYLSHFAAIGLVHAYTATGDARYADGAWRWLSWYQARMDATGYVTDYDLVNGVLTSTGDMDSTDSYAAMFVVAAYNAHVATGSTAKTTALRTGISKAVSAIESTMQADGLTWAKPAWRVKYLMDQAETYAGLRSAAWLAKNVLGDSDLATRADADADRLKAGVATLWNEAAGGYDWAKHENGARQATNWANLYSDALQQVWAVAFGLVDDTSRANALLDRFNASHPRWDRPAETDQFDGVPHMVEYWPVAAWAFSRQGNQLRADQALTNIRNAAITANRAWPFHTMANGQILFLEAKAFEMFPATSSTGAWTSTPTVDTGAPSAPRLNAVLRTSGKKLRQVDLSWSGATDNVAVGFYHLYRNGLLITTVSSLAYADTAIGRNTSYSYAVVAVDPSGNASAASNVVTIRT